MFLVLLPQTFFGKLLVNKVETFFYKVETLTFSPRQEKDTLFN